jgi:hypothetical protein
MRRYTLPIVFAVLGFLLSTKTWIRAYDKLPPYGGLIVYYTIITITILALEHLGLAVGGIEFFGFRHTIGTLLVVFSFFILFDWESCYINIVTKGDCKDVSQTYFASEDGAVYDLWNRLFPEKYELNRILTYVLTPFVLCLVGILLLTPHEKVKLTL